MLFSGDSLPASAFLACGFVHEVVPADELVAATERLVAALAKKSPLALRRMKRSSMPASISRARARRSSSSSPARRTSPRDMHEGLAAFDERRPPRFLGR